MFPLRHLQIHALTSRSLAALTDPEGKLGVCLAPHCSSALSTRQRLNEEEWVVTSLKARFSTNLALTEHTGRLHAAAAAAKSLQSCPTPCDPRDRSPPGSTVPGILQARTLEWVAISFSNAWKWSRSVVSNSQRPYGLQSTMLLRPWDFPGKSTGVGCHCLLWQMCLVIY